jgi:hypothetical protein
MAQYFISIQFQFISLTFAFAFNSFKNFGFIETSSKFQTLQSEKLKKSMSSHSYLVPTYFVTDQEEKKFYKIDTSRAVTTPTVAMMNKPPVIGYKTFLAVIHGLAY